MGTHQIILAGFGGQGILFAGKLIAYSGMLEGREVSWLPSYGPEMRGGTCNCHVILSNEPVASPIIQNPDILIAMNLPSLDKFENQVKSGGYIFLDSTLIGRDVKRTDVTTVRIPATQMASDMSGAGLANMVILGKVLKVTGMMQLDEIKKAMIKSVSARKRNLADLNNTVLEAGYNFE